MAKQVFRLMGMPDKVLVFDELPARFLVGLDMIGADGFPRHWKEWMGKSKKVMRIPPDKNPLTGQTIVFDPIIEEGYFFYTVDWNIRVQEERWADITEYVKKNAPQDMRIPDKLADLAKPLAKDKLEAVSLEPEDVVVIPLPKELTNGSGLITANGKQSQKEPLETFKCSETGCDATFDKKQGLRMHVTFKHKKEPVLLTK